jgi:hypothetical protein
MVKQRTCKGRDFIWNLLRCCIDVEQARAKENERTQYHGARQSCHWPRDTDIAIWRLYLDNAFKKHVQQLSILTRRDLNYYDATRYGGSYNNTRPRSARRIRRKIIRWS